MKIFPLGGKNEQENRIQYWNGCLRSWVSVLEVIGSLNQKRRNDLASIYRRRKWNPLQCSCLENPRDRAAWWAASMGSQSWTRLKQLSSSSSVHSFMLGVGWCFSLQRLLVAECGLWGGWASVVVVHGLNSCASGLSCSAACGILLNQGSHP